MRETLGWLARGFSFLLLLYFFLLNLVYLFMSLSAFKALRKYVWRLKAVSLKDMLASGGVLPITVIVPAFNEEKNCVETLQALLKQNYPNFEIFLVNDGSTDRTLERLHEVFALEPTAHIPTADLPTRPIRVVYRSQSHPQVWVIDKENGGKADALNAGLNFCQTPLFCSIDADSLLENDALLRVERPFLEDERTLATGGIVRIINGCRVEEGAIREVRLSGNFWAALQALEYLRAFHTSRMGWNTLGSTLIISGAFGLFKRGIVVEAGGYSTDTVGEDMELVVRLHRYCRDRHIPYRIHFIPDPVAWTECPETIANLARQRDRWQRGLTEVLLRHRGMLFNPRYGFLGLVAYPYFFFLEMLGPLVELIGYGIFLLALVLGQLSLAHMIAFFVFAFLFGLTLSVAAVALEELTFRRYRRLQDIWKLFALAIVENFGYRQMYTWWRARGTLAACFGKRRHHWGEMERKGYHGVDSAARVKVKV